MPSGRATRPSGATAPPPTILDNACGGHPTVPAEVDNLATFCAGPPCGGPGGECEKRGTKFNDLDGDGQAKEPGEPGLGGWVIRAYTFPGAAFAGQVSTDASGNYAFTGPTGLTCGTYTFCEVLQATWTQTFPAVVGGGVVSCAGIDNTFTLGPLGYRETLVAGSPATGNDFGNHQQPPPTPVRGKTQGFWHNQNGHAILDTNNDGN